jgi:hypothetical protein
MKTNLLYCFNNICRRICFTFIGVFIFLVDFAAGNLNNRITTGPIDTETFIDVQGFLQNTNNAYVQWHVSDQNDIASYDIEKSTDGLNYIKVGSVPVARTNISDYNWTDEDLMQGATFYRIRAVENDGREEYSRKVTIAYGNTDNSGIPDITIFPNPVSTNGTIGLQTTNIPDGVYTVLLVNESGQAIFTTQLDHTEGNTVETITTNTSLQSGVYFMTITGRDNAKFILKAVVR